METLIKFKIKVANPKQSREIQRILFSLGFSWGRGSKIQETNKPLLFFEKSDFWSSNHKLDITYSNYLDPNFEDFAEYEEVTFKQLKSEEFQDRVKKLILVESLTDGH